MGDNREIFCLAVIFLLTEFLLISGCISVNYNGSDKNNLVIEKDVIREGLFRSESVNPVNIDEKLNPGSPLTLIPNLNKTGELILSKSSHNSTNSSSGFTNIKTQRIYQNELESTWKEIRLIKLETAEQYRRFEPGNSNIINHIRYTILPKGEDRLRLIEKKVNSFSIEDESLSDSKDTQLIVIQYTALYFKAVSAIMHAQQYTILNDPKGKVLELRNARNFTIDALDIINRKNITEYPENYRGEISEDNSVLTQLAKTITSDLNT